MKAFHGKQEIKDYYLARVRAHRAADEIVSGQYWQKDKDGVFRGCAVGYTLHSNSHKLAKAEIGFPEALMWLEDCIFERMPAEERPMWPERCYDAQ